jgi:hypothetical protein
MMLEGVHTLNLHMLSVLSIQFTHHEHVGMVGANMAEPLDQRIQLVISKGQVREIDEWRRLQPDLPSRSEAIRRLIEAGLNAEMSNGPKQGRPSKS